MPTFEIASCSPPRLYRGFRNADHAQAFVNHGRVRFGLVQMYRSIEDEARRDASEGNGQLQVPSDAIVTLHVNRESLKIVERTSAPGLLNFGSSYMNPVYALCMSGPDVNLEYLRARMGPYVIRIDDPDRLVQAVATALRPVPIPEREIFFLRLAEVRYDKGAIGAKPIDTTTLSYAQKPPSFHEEREQRLVVGVSGALVNAPREVFLDIGGTQDFCTIL